MSRGVDQIDEFRLVGRMRAATRPSVRWCLRTVDSTGAPVDVRRRLSGGGGHDFSWRPRNNFLDMAAMLCMATIHELTSKEKNLSV
jgi:hypothetical protein